MVLSSINIQNDETKQSRKKRNRDFIKHVHAIESYPSIEDVPKDELRAFRERYFGKISSRKNTDYIFKREVDPELPPVITSDIRIYNVYIDLMENDCSLNYSVRKNKIDSKQFYNKVKRRNLIIYNDFEVNKVISGGSYKEVIDKGKQLGIKVPESIKQYNINKGHFSGKRSHKARATVHHYLQKVVYLPNNLSKNID